MLALAEYEGSLCPSCGGPAADCQSSDSDRNNPRAKWMYSLDLPLECHRTTALRLSVDRDYGDDKRALLHRVYRHRRGKPQQRG